MRQNLEQFRKQSNLTQAQIANILGISERQYRRIENKESLGTIEFWLKISAYFNTTIDYLLQ